MAGKRSHSLSKFYLAGLISALAGAAPVSAQPGSAQQASTQPASPVFTADQEETLGIETGRAPQLKLVYEEKSRGDGEKPITAESYAAGLDITKVWFGNVAGDRFIWAVDFAGPIDPAKFSLIFYLDTDNNPKTGRQTGIVGPDLMAWVETAGTRAQTYRPDGTIGGSKSVRSAIVGNRVYLVADTDLAQQTNQSNFRMMLLAEVPEPRQGVDNTPFFDVVGAGISNRAKRKNPLDVTANRNMVTTWGLHQLERITGKPGNVTLPIRQAELNGFELATKQEYRASSAIRSAVKGSIKVKVPQAGKWYPAFILYDDYGPEHMGLYVNGQLQGIAVADEDNRDQKLYTLTRPFDFKAGDTLELRNAETDSRYRVEDLYLLKSLPPASKRNYTIDHVEATVNTDGASPQVGITFITSWDVVPRIEWGIGSNLNQKIEGIKGTPLNNHRFFLPGVQANRKYSYRVVATDDNGNVVTGPMKSFSTSPPHYPTAKVSARRVPLRLSAPVPEGQTWPVTGGVPLPQGEVFESANFRLVDNSGREVPVQVQVIGRWRDGSIKWVLLDLQAGSGARDFVLEYGSTIKRTANLRPIAIQQTASETLLDTGSLRVSFDKKRSGLFAQIWRDLNGDGKYDDAEAMLDNARPAGITLVGPDGKTYSTLAEPDEIAMEETGPLRAVVRISGALRDGSAKLFRYTLRLHVFAGSPVIKLQATLENDAVKDFFTSVKSAVLRLPLKANGAVRAAVGGAGEMSPATATPIRVFQDFDTTYSATGGTTSTGSRAPGWAQWQDEGHAVTLAVRDFWQQYPKSLSASNDGLEIGLLPELAAGQYARFKGTVEEYRSVFYLMDGAYKLQQGMTKTHEVLFAFGAPGAIENGEALAALANERPLLIAEPQWYRGTRVFHDFALGQDSPVVAQYDEAVAESFKDYLADRDRLHEYGMMNFGDWWGERGINWGNIEYDTQHAMFLQFARSGDPRYLMAGEQAELHNRDVDTVHYAPLPDHVGRVHIHTIGHLGGYFSVSPVPGQGSPGPGFTVSHTWTQGHMEHYFLTGDRRSLETGKLIADNFNTYTTRNYDYTNARESGWHLILTMAVYEATNDPFYLNAGRIIVDRVLERQTPDGGFRRQLVPGHCDHEVNHFGEAGFMLGVQMSGLKYYHLATGDPRVAQSLVRCAHYLIDDMWIPSAKAYRYTSCPGTSPATGLNFLLSEGVAYAWNLSRNDKSSDILRKVTVAAIDSGIKAMRGMGKDYSMQTRSTPLTLSDVVPMLKIQDNVTAEATAKAPGIGEGNQVVFDASKTRVLKGTVTKYEWDFGDGSRGEGKTVRHAYNGSGTFTVSLKATDSTGEISTFDFPVFLYPVSLQKADVKKIALLEAENFAAQGGGEVQLKTDRINISGKMLTFWESSLGHWLQWNLEVPQTGRYKIVLKYASNSAPQRDVQIDGKYPYPALQKVTFPTTGGFSTAKDDWNYATLGENETKPYEFDLTAGTHTLRMSNLGGGMGLDYIMLVRAD